MTCSTAKLGLATRQEDDEPLVNDLISLLNTHHTDWTLFWRRLATLCSDASAPEQDAAVRDLVVDRSAFDAWAKRYRTRLIAESSVDTERAERMNRVNPKYVLRNHLAETAIRRARGDEGSRDFGEIERLLAVLSRPYDEQPGNEAYATEPPEWAQSLHLSCSS